MWCNLGRPYALMESCPVGRDWPAQCHPHASLSADIAAPPGAQRMHCMAWPNQVVHEHTLCRYSALFQSGVRAHCFCAFFAASKTPFTSSWVHAAGRLCEVSLDWLLADKLLWQLSCLNKHAHSTADLTGMIPGSPCTSKQGFCVVGLVTFWPRPLVDSFHSPFTRYFRRPSLPCNSSKNPPPMVLLVVQGHSRTDPVRQR